MNVYSVRLSTSRVGEGVCTSLTSKCLSLPLSTTTGIKVQYQVLQRCTGGFNSSMLIEAKHACDQVHPQLLQHNEHAFWSMTSSDLVG